jgi:hypothetical protein
MLDAGQAAAPSGGQDDLGGRPPLSPPQAGLRERKKARTRASLREHEQVSHLGIESMRPDLKSFACPAQSNSESQVLARPAHGSLHEKAGAELPANLPNVQSCSLETDRRAPRYDPQTRNLGEPIDQFLSQTLANIVVFRLGAHVVQRQHCQSRRICRLADCGHHNPLPGRTLHRLDQFADGFVSL